MLNNLHIICPVLGIGSRLDLAIIAPLLEEAGFNVTRYPVSDRSKKTRSGRLALQVLKHPHRFDANIFLGAIFPEWLPLARKNIWIPNPEGFNEQKEKWLSHIDVVLAKTRLTERLFRERGCNTVYTGFTSLDHFEPVTGRDYTRFFHACSSPQKGTKRLIQTWGQHPEWPELVVTITNDDPVVRNFKAANVRILTDYLEDAEFRQMQNKMGFHICCSEAEGFGHYIMEAMSTGAVTFVTNGPPMNELVQPDRGLLIEHLPNPAPLGLTHAHLFDPGNLGEQIHHALKLTPSERDEIGRAGRAFFLENDRVFRQTFPRNYPLDLISLCVVCDVALMKAHRR